jgi:hypothetical protein
MLVSQANDEGTHPVNTFTITATDPDADPEVAGERGTVATVHGTRGEALARGCMAILDGWTDVQVESTFRVWHLKDVA